MSLSHKNKSVNVHQFSMVPKPDVPRSSFSMQKTLKTTFDAGYLVPIMCEEVLPGDTFRTNVTAFARLATPIFPFMDNLYLETFAFFVPCRLVWDNWEKFMGQQANPADSISFTIPQQVCPAGGYAVGSLQDLIGLPTVGQVGGASTVTHNALPLRAYNLIYNAWFRDENLQNSLVVDLDDGPDTVTDYVLKRRGKRHDYFTSCLPWTQKGGVSVSIPGAGNATVKAQPSDLLTGAREPIRWRQSTAGATPPQSAAGFGGGSLNMSVDSTLGGAFTPAAGGQLYAANLYADLSTATLATVNQLRQSFQIQRLLERDARGGTRYGEMIRAHFGVVSPDARLQRPEYLGGGKASIIVNPIAQTSVTAATPQGNLAGAGTVLARSGFTQSFTEHGYVIMLACVDADLTYQQGLRKLWSRSTRYDFYFPAFAMLGEQSVLNREIYCDGSANDALVFGYQERWAEYRYNPSQIVGAFRSTNAVPIDAWHLAQDFSVLPVLNASFIESVPPVSRVVAVGAGANGQQFIMDCFFDTKAARPLPMYSVPGLIDHF